MEITLSDLLKGNSTIIKGNEYLSTERYVAPFIAKVKDFNPTYKIQAKLADQLQNTTDNAIFNRVHIQAIMPEETDGFQEVIGFCYALDTRKPVAKLYKAVIETATGNMFAFDRNDIGLQEIEPETALSYPIKQLMERPSTITKDIETLNNTSFKRAYDDRCLKLGHWITKAQLLKFESDFGKVKLATGMPTDVYNILFEESTSDHYVSKEFDNFTAFDAFGAFASIVKEDEKDIINKFEKSVLISELLK